MSNVVSLAAARCDRATKRLTVQLLLDMVHSHTRELETIHEAAAVEGWTPERTERVRDVDMMRLVALYSLRDAMKAARILVDAWPERCGGDDPPVCEDARLPSRSELHCESELRAQAARPLDASLPGAITIKTVLDRAADGAIYFQDTETYTVHSRFAIEQLGWPPGQPFVDQYYSPSRRFILGSVTYYEEPQVFAYEIAPYDTASVEMIAQAFHTIADASYYTLTKNGLQAGVAVAGTKYWKDKELN